MLRDEEKLGLSAASKHVPDHPHASTLWRWCREGLHGVRLEYLKVGRRIVTSREALDRFFERITEADQAAYADRHPIQPSHTSPTKASQDSSLAAAERELTDAGI